MAVTQRHKDIAVCAPLPAPEASALARLARLHGEAGHNLVLAQFLSRVPAACLVLMSAGAAALTWTALAGGGSLKADFCWAALLLFGIAAMTRNYIRGFARSLRRTPLEEAASDLRILLLYMGMAWGMGAFLVMPDAPAPALTVLFAVLPSLGVAVALKNRSGLQSFLLPATVIPVAAAIMGAWPLDIWAAAAILAANLAILALTGLTTAPRVALHTAIS